MYLLHFLNISDLFCWKQEALYFKWIEWPVKSIKDKTFLIYQAKEALIL